MFPFFGGRLFQPARELLLDGAGKGGGEGTDGAGKRGGEGNDGAGKRGGEGKNGAGKHGGDEKAGAGKRRGDEKSKCPPGLGGLLKESNDRGAVRSTPVKFELEVEDAVSVQLRSNRKRSISFQNAGFLKDSSSAAMSEAEKFSRSVGTSIKAEAEG